MSERTPALPPVKPWLLALALSAVCVAVFAGSLGGPFLLDDESLIANNPAVVQGDIRAIWTGALTEDAGDVHFYRPWVMTSFALEWWLAPGNPLLFHASNLVLYGALVALTFFTLLRWSGSVPGAFIATLLLGVHTSRAEPVGWISGRMDLWCMVGLLIATAGYACRTRPKALALQIAGTFLAYASKETAVVLPLLIAVEHWVQAGKPALGRATIRGAFRAVVPKAVVAVTYLVGRALLLPLGGTAMPALDHWGLTRVKLVLASLGQAHSSLLWPYAPRFGRALVEQDSLGKLLLPETLIVLGGTSLIIGLCIAWKCRKVLPAATVGLLLWLALLTPTLSIFPPRVATYFAERYLMIPLLGLGLLGAELVARLLATSSRTRRRLSIWCGTACAGVVASWTTASWSRAWEYADAKTFWNVEHERARTYLPAWEALIRLDLQDGKNQAAFDKTAAAARLAQERFPRDRLRTSLLLRGLDLTGKLLPDFATSELQQLAHIYGALAKRTAVLHFDVAGLPVHVDPSVPYVQEFLRAQELRLMLGEAQIRNRLEQDAASLALSGAARAKCERCAEATLAHAMFLARAGQATEALELLTQVESEPRIAEFAARLQGVQGLAGAVPVLHNPEAAQPAAKYLAVLGAYGRAAKRLTPVLPSLQGSVSAAELFFCAGDPQTARELLGASVSPTAFDALSEQWRTNMGWR